MRMTSDVSYTKGLVAIPSEWYKGRVDAVDMQRSQRTNNPMLVFTWIVEHDGKERKMPPDYVMIGGKDKNGKPMGLQNLLRYIGGLHVPWKCSLCGNETTKAPYRKPREEDFHCPMCDQVLAAIDYDTESFVGKWASIYVDVEEGQRKNAQGELEPTGEDRNRVTQVKELQ